MTSDHLHHAKRGWGVSALHGAIVKEGGVVDRFEELPASCACSLAARHPAVSDGAIATAGHMPYFVGLSGTVTDQGFDVSR